VSRNARRRAALTAAVTVAMLLLALAATAHAAVWTVGPTSEVYPVSKPLSARAIQLYAAGNEYESAQIALRGHAESVSLSWAPGSDPLLTGNSSLFHVRCVVTKRASMREHLRVGAYPDPLLPASFGQAVAIAATSTSFFVLVHIPNGTSAGTYSGAIDVTEPGGTTSVPVSVQVFSFGWDRLSMHTSLGLNPLNIKKSLRGALPWNDATENALLAKYYKFWAEHGVSPTILQPLPTHSSSGSAPTNDLADGLSPWLDGGGLDGQGFLDTQFPLRDRFPYPNWSADRGRIETYVADMVRFYQSHGWGGRTYAYVIDEPRKPSQIRLAEKYAQIIHAGSAKAGYREPFLLTDEPRTKTLSGAPPNKALWNDVDIWCPRIFHFWEDLTNLRRQQAQGKQVWWYNYASGWSGRFPSWLIDRANTDIRAQEWMAAAWGVQGTMYWGSNRWTKLNSSAFRDPYGDTASFGNMRTYIANGEASFIYPGYEPSVGLNDPTAGPVSSLRMEALRSGLQDYQYFQIARALAKGSTLPGAAAYPARVAAAVIHYQYGPYALQWHNVPGWSGDPDTYTNAKVHLGTFIERLQAGRGLVVVHGTVRDAATGKPVGYATVSDGIVSATTATDGSFTLSGVLPQARLTISQPRYASANASYNEGDPAITVELTPRSPIRVLSTFESASAFQFPNAGSATLSTAHATTGRRSVKLVFRSWRTVWSLAASAGRLSAFRELDLDVYNPQSDARSTYHEWFLYLTASDAHGRQITQRFLLAPHAWNHLRLSLRHGSFDRRAVRTIGMYVYPVKGQTIYVDSVFAR
jgi:hypothetical protein